MLPVRGVSYLCEGVPAGAVRRDLAAIRGDLHCTAVMVMGTDPAGLLDAAREALDTGLDVYVRPHLPDRRRRVLLGYFGEQVVDPCGHCDGCEAGTARVAEPASDSAAAEDGLGSRAGVRHPEWGDGVVMSTEPDRVTVLFAEHGYKTLSLDAVRENDLLEPLDPAAVPEPVTSA